MKKSCIKLVLALLAPALLLAVPSRTHADLVPWGDPVIGHSWDQLWVQSLDQPFDTITAKMVQPPDTIFEAPGFLGFSVSGWTITSMTTREMVAQGPDTTRLEFKTHFSGLPTDYTAESPLIFDMRFFDNGTEVSAQRWIWDGATWVDPPPPGVPDGGATLVLFGLSTLGLVLLRKKIRS